MCNVPVTLGGGNWMQYARAGIAAGAMRKTTASLQRAKLRALAEPALPRTDGGRTRAVVEREARRQLRGG